MTYPTKAQEQQPEIQASQSRAQAAFMQDLAFEAVQLVVNRLFARLKHSDRQAVASVTESANNSNSKASLIFQNLFQKATGIDLSSAIQADRIRNHSPVQPLSIPSEPSVMAFEHMMEKCLIEASNNAARNVQRSVLQASGISEAEISRRMERDYDPHTGHPSKITSMVNKEMGLRSRLNPSNISNPAQGSHLRLYRHQIQDYLHTVLNKDIRSILREASRIVAERSLSQFKEVISGTPILASPILNSFSLYQRKLNSKTALEAPRLEVPADKQPERRMALRPVGIK